MIELQDGQRIETVIMRYGDVALDNYPVLQKEKLTTDGTFQFKSNKRATVCVSSQVGCAMGCTFCATGINDSLTFINLLGTMNLLANLNPGEILEQLCKNRYSTTNSIDHANQVEKIRNVVFMGMGEPLDNYDAVLDAVDVMASRLTSINTMIPRLILIISHFLPFMSPFQLWVSCRDYYSYKKMHLKLV